MIAGIGAKMKLFDHVKVADYSLGATYISKWIYAIHKAATEKKRAPSRSPNLSLNRNKIVYDSV